jgi:hypothetical protein
MYASDLIYVVTFLIFHILVFIHSFISYLFIYSSVFSNSRSIICEHRSVTMVGIAAMVG